MKPDAIRVETFRRHMEMFRKECALPGNPIAQEFRCRNYQFNLRRLLGELELLPFDFDYYKE